MHNQYVNYAVWLFTAIPALVAVGYVTGLGLNRLIDWADRQTRPQQ